MAGDQRWGEWQRAKRMLLMDELRVGRCHWLVLRPSVFVQAGERYRTEPSGLRIEHDDGSRTTHPGSWETRFTVWTLNGDPGVGQ
ncbi:hypothetical protein BDK92_6251 [Micromonospora pisi]|uniref:Uncharacterized protein n=1 Tax=Micromonospora pisi TaxID=589240 RepID=A0A495JUM0_9ACTN|nr:hypothetical protein BDK92_6251 [Micromonospora pisi]